MAGVAMRVCGKEGGVDLKTSRKGEEALVWEL